MIKRKYLIVLLVTFFSSTFSGTAQLFVVDEPVVQNLIQKLVGNGVSISNVSFRGNSLMTGHFYNNGGNNISLDSGIALTTGRARSFGSVPGLNGNGIATASSVLADNSWNLGGDPDLSLAINNTNLHDACVLEFDFVPLGDSIKFNYVFSSEEYTPDFVCSFNDAFAFFISGPGIPGLKNIALLPGTNTPVSIFNVNNVLNSAGVPLCRNNPQYYIDNTTNRWFNHDGHTVIFTASERVQPCQTYHLKIVIADAGDPFYDSGVFLGAKSLTSNALSFTNQTQIDPQTGSNYLVEGCASGSFAVSRATRDPFPLSVNLVYGGTAINGVDVASLPLNVIIPANDSVITIPVTALTDALTEGIETLKIYANAGCASGIPNDSTTIQIRDYDRLPIVPSPALICRGSSIQLTAASGFGAYQWTWTPAAAINNAAIANPVVTPQSAATWFTCTAGQGSCRARDSVFISWKSLELLSVTGVLCENGTTGSIHVSGGPEWTAPVQFSLDGLNWQSDSSFSNLAVGTYWVKIKDGVCQDSIQVAVTQTFANLGIANIITSPATCSGIADGTIQFSGTGGNNVYTYSLDGGAYQSSNSFTVNAGTHTITVKDGNGCTSSRQVIIPTANNLVVDAGTDVSICEGESYLMRAQAVGTTFSWSPGSTLNNPTLLNPVATPAVTTWYYLTVSDGACNKTDSLLITVRPAPNANAGPDINICIGKTFTLNGSGGITYQWSPDTYFLSPSTIPNPDVKAMTNISYALFVTDAFNCRTLVPDTVHVRITPAVRLFAGNDTIAAINQPLQLLVTDRNNSGVTSYSWSPSVYLSDGSLANPVATLQSDQRFIVRGTTPDGCEGSDDILVKVYKGPEIYVPSGFTPNNDGKNDRLRPIAAGFKEVRYFNVYNRTGQLIYSGSGSASGWDGTFKGVAQPTGVYIWVIDATDYLGNQLLRKGVVSLIR